MSFITGTNAEILYASIKAGSAKASFTSEVAINDTTGMGAVAHLPTDFWGPGPSNAVGRAIKIVGRGIVSSTATPTYTFTTRLGTQGSTSAAIVLGSAALTTGSGISNQFWEFEGDVVLEALGAAGANSTVRGAGQIRCGGLASPFMYSLFGGAASPGTIATVDTSIVNYINFNVTCSANAAGNSIQLLQLIVYGLN